MLSLKSQIVITCEHGGNKIPTAFRPIFLDNKHLLNSHLGYDPGALMLARMIAKYNECPFVYETVSRLLIEQNRSRHRSTVFSKISSELSQNVKLRLLETIYDSYHRKVDEIVNLIVARKQCVLHFSIHSFTPVFNNETRNADIGLLYDPTREKEKYIGNRISAELKDLNSDLKVRKNYPYKGTSDGLTSSLRKRYSQKEYCGIEVEVNQKHFFERTPVWKMLMTELPVVIRKLAD